ncbi:MAG: MBL fold metallo-hydrolase [Acidothermales bacterium]|nr:MBL fold metallo-hydrolase [Acidothermales bacterium]
MTLDGTNTWVLAEPSATRAVVVDPGPDDEAHLRAVLDAVGAGGRTVAVCLLTHGHPDHAAGARRFAELSGASVRAYDEAHRVGSAGLADGDVIEVDGLEVGVVTTPGHTADSVCFLLPADRAVLTGDTVLGRGTTVVAHPDGVLGDYLDSLRRLRELGELTVLPGHGPELPNAGLVAEHYLRHREARLEQVREAFAAGASTPEQVVASVYADVDRSLWPAALLSVRAQLAYLTHQRSGT